MNRQHLIDRLKTARSKQEGKPTGQRGTRIVGHNLHYDESQWDVAVRYHATNVVVYHANGCITLNTGGYYTPTTAARMNEYLPSHLHVQRRKRKWVVFNGHTREHRFFHEGYNREYITIPAREVFA
jgi:hypothetical protein